MLTISVAQKQEWHISQGRPGCKALRAKSNISVVVTFAFIKVGTKLVADVEKSLHVILEDIKLPRQEGQE